MLHRLYHILHNKNGLGDCSIQPLSVDLEKPLFIPSGRNSRKILTSSSRSLLGEASLSCHSNIQCPKNIWMGGNESSGACDNFEDIFREETLSDFENALKGDLTQKEKTD